MAYDSEGWEGARKPKEAALAVLGHRPLIEVVKLWPVVKQLEVTEWPQVTNDQPWTRISEWVPWQGPILSLVATSWGDARMIVKTYNGQAFWVDMVPERSGWTTHILYPGDAVKIDVSTLRFDDG